MMIQAVTVFLALIGTTLSCITTGARVTYAMGRDKEIGGAFGELHAAKLTPHKAIWTLATVSAIVGVVAVFLNFCGGAALTDDTIKSCKALSGWYSFGLIPNSIAAQIPQGMLIMTLVSNFGTFLLYMMTCFVAILAFKQHHTFNGIKHFVIPVFGLLANLACMLFYLVAPLPAIGVPNMRWQEPWCALGVVGIWGLYGAIHFIINTKKYGKTVFLTPPSAATTGT